MLHMLCDAVGWKNYFSLPLKAVDEQCAKLKLSTSSLLCFLCVYQTLVVGNNEDNYFQRWQSHLLSPPFSALLRHCLQNIYILKSPYQISLPKSASAFIYVSCLLQIVWLDVWCE